MGSLSECKIEGFICRLCSQIDRNVIHIYTDEGLQKKLEQKINVYLKINLTRYDPLPKVICLPCDAKLEQHHRFIQRVIQNQKKIQGERPGERPIIPLLEQHLRVRVSPVIREDGSGTNTYNIEAISSSDSDSSEANENTYQSPPYSPRPVPALRSSIGDTNPPEEHNLLEELSDPEPLTNSSTSSSNNSLSDVSMNDEPLAGFSPNLEPVNASWSSSTSSSSSSSSSNDTDSDDVIPVSAATIEPTDN